MAADSSVVSKADSGPAKGPRKGGRFRRILLIVVLGLIVLVAAAPTLISALGRARIESAAREALKTDVSIGALSLGWLSGLEVGDIRIEPTPDGKPGVSIGSISAKPAISSLFRGRVDVPEIVVKHVTLDITKKTRKPGEKEEEEEEEPEPPEGAPPKSVPGFGVRAVIEDVTIAYRDPAWDQPLRVEHIGPVTIAASSDDATHVEVAAGPSVKVSLDVLWAKDGKKLRRRDRKLTGTVVLDHTDLATFQGAVAPWADELRGVVDGTIQIEMAGKALESSGNLKLSGVAFAPRGRAGEPHRLADVTVKHDLKRDVAGIFDGIVELIATGADLAPLSAGGQALRIEKADLRARLQGNVTVEVERLAVEAPFGRVTASAKVPAGKDQGPLTAKLQAEAAVDKLAQWLGGMPEMTGSLSSQATVARDADGTLEVRGATTLANFGAKDVPGVGALREQSIVLKHDLDWGGETVRMHDVSLKSSFATARCSGSLQPGAPGAAPEGEVAVELGADLDVIAGLFGEHLPVKPKGKLAASGKVKGLATEGTAFDVTVKGSKIVLSDGPFTAGPLDLGNPEITCKGRLSPDGTELGATTLALTTRVASINGQVAANGLRNPHPNIAAALSGRIEPDPILAACKPDLFLGPLGTVPISVTLKGTDAAWEIQASRFEVAGLVALIEGTFPHADVPAGAGTVSARVEGPVDRIVRLLSDGPRLAGAIKLDATASLGARQDFDVKLQAPSLTFTGTDKKSVTGEVTASAQGAYDPATGAVEVKSLTATGPGATFAGTVMFRPGQSAKFDVRSDVTMAEASPILAFVAPSIRGAGKGALRAAGELALVEGAPPDASRASFDLTLDRLKTDMFEFENVGVDAVLEGGVARTRKASATLNGGSAQLDATVDLRPKVPEWKGKANLDRVRITKEMQPAIARAIPLFAGLSATVSGSIGADLDLAGRGDSWEAAKPTLTGTGILGLSGTRLSQSEILAAVGKFVGIPRDLAFEDFQTKFQVQNGAVRQDRLVLSSDQFDIRMAGTTSLEGRLNYDVGIKPKGRNSSEKWKKIKPVLDKDGFLPFRLQGDVTHPSPKLPKMEDLLGGAVDDLLKGGLEDLLKKKKKN